MTFNLCEVWSVYGLIFAVHDIKCLLFTCIESNVVVIQPITDKPNELAMFNT